MNKFLSIQDAAKCLGVSLQTLRRWEKQKKITPCYRTQGENSSWFFKPHLDLDRKAFV